MGQRWDLRGTEGDERGTSVPPLWISPQTAAAHMSDQENLCDASSVPEDKFIATGRVAARVLSAWTVLSVDDIQLYDEPERYRLWVIDPVLASLPFGTRWPVLRNRRIRRRSGESAVAAKR